MPPNRTAGENRSPVVLIVEDNDAMRALIRSLVEEATPAVQECANAEEAIERYPRINPDWVLMDIRLGGMDGITATRALRQLDPDARVVIVTEHGDRRYRTAARAAGASGFVLKENLLELTALLASDAAETSHGSHVDPPTRNSDRSP